MPMPEREPSSNDEASEREPRVRRPLRCWSCEELLALPGPRGGWLLEADAQLRDEDGRDLIVCGCGARSLLPDATSDVAGEQRVGSGEPSETMTTPEARLVLDYHHETRGLWRDGAVFRVRVFSRGDEAPVVIASELLENTNISVTNFAEVLAAEVIAQHLPERFEHEDPAVWLEHYPPLPGVEPEKFPFDRVTFSSWRPRIRDIGGVTRLSLGEPAWQALSARQLATLLGHETARALIAERAGERDVER
jgi:hypothetical protein